MELEEYKYFLVHTPKMTTEEIKSSLTKDIKEVEIINAIWTLHLEKSSGPDGFTISFYRTFWDVIKRDLIKMILWVQRKKGLGDSQI